MWWFVVIVVYPTNTASGRSHCIYRISQFSLWAQQLVETSYNRSSTITMATSLFQCWFRLLSFNDRSYKACLPNDVEYFVYPHTLLRTCLNYARCLGRKPSLLPHAELGLFLFFIGSANNIKHLCLIFGATPSVCSRSLWKLLNQIPGIEIILLQGSNFDLKQKCNSWQHWFNHMSLLLMT